MNSNNKIDVKLQWKNINYSIIGTDSSKRLIIIIIVIIIVIITLLIIIIFVSKPFKPVHVKRDIIINANGSAKSGKLSIIINIIAIAINHHYHHYQENYLR